jgi:hypothetical protein
VPLSFGEGLGVRQKVFILGYTERTPDIVQFHSISETSKQEKLQEIKYFGISSCKNDE